jgi:hypothetical protein
MDGCTISQKWTWHARVPLVFLAYGIEGVRNESCFARLFDYNGDMLSFTALRT